jgi:hypothetical protein
MGTKANPLINTSMWYGTDEGWWLRLMMALLICLAVVLQIRACMEGSIEKRLRDEEGRDARAIKRRSDTIADRNVKSEKDKEKDAKSKKVSKNK